MLLVIVSFKDKKKSSTTTTNQNTYTALLQKKETSPQNQIILDQEISPLNTTVLKPNASRKKKKLLQCIKIQNQMSLDVLHTIYYKICKCFNHLLSASITSKLESVSDLTLPFI